MAFPSKQTVQAVAKAGRAAAATLRKEKKEPVLTDMLKEAVELMVFSAQTRKEAAQTIGCSDEYLRRSFTKPDVLAYFNQCQEVLRTSARPRALHKIIALSDKADSERVMLDASKYLDGMDRGAHQVGAAQVNVQVNNSVTVTPGYVIRIDRTNDKRAPQIDHLEQDDVIPLDALADVPEEE